MGLCLQPTQQACFIAKLQVLQNLKGFIFAWLFVVWLSGPKLHTVVQSHRTTPIMGCPWNALEWFSPLNGWEEPGPLLAILNTAVQSIDLQGNRSGTGSATPKG